MCTPCVNNCSSCSAARECLSCLSPLVLEGSACVERCSNGAVGVNQVCVLCSSNCLTCTAVTLCATCREGQFLFNATCLPTCPLSTYVSASAALCIACPLSCAACLNASYCTQCSANYQLKDALCISLCPAAYVPVGGVCAPCATGCTHCSILPNNCTLCTPPYYYYLLRCYPSCYPPLFHYPINFTCLVNCPDGFYNSYLQSSQSVGGVCTACPFSCLLCLSSTRCTSCQPSVFLFQQFCYAQCPLTAPYRLNNTCTTCSISNCAQCNGTLCSQCITPFLLLTASSSCIQNCNKGYIYYNGSCVQNNISFLPMPYAILFLMTLIFLCVWHPPILLHAIVTANGILLGLGTVTTIITYYVSAFSQTVIYIVLAAYGLFILINVIAVFFAKLYLTQSFTQVSNPQSKPLTQDIGQHKSHLPLQKECLFICLSLLHYQIYYLRHQQIVNVFIRLASIPANLFLISSAITLLLTTAVRPSEYLFFSCVQISILALIHCLLNVYWYKCENKQNNRPNDLSDTPHNASQRPHGNTSIDHIRNYDSLTEWRAQKATQECRTDGIDWHSQYGIDGLQQKHRGKGQLSFDSELDSAAKMQQINQNNAANTIGEVENVVFEVPAQENQTEYIHDEYIPENNVQGEAYDQEHNIIFVDNGDCPYIDLQEEQSKRTLIQHQEEEIAKQINQMPIQFQDKINYKLNNKINNRNEIQRPFEKEKSFQQTSISKKYNKIEKDKFLKVIDVNEDIFSVEEQQIDFKVQQKQSKQQTCFDNSNKEQKPSTFFNKTAMNFAMRNK